MASVSRGLFVAGGAAAALGASASPARAVYGDTPISGQVTIGVVGPFTGDDIRLGEQMANGVRAAIDDANLMRGTLDKAYLIRTFDDQNLLATGLVNAEFTCDDPQVVAVVGHLSGRITEAALQTYVNNQMPVICPASSYDRLTEHGYGNLLRLQAKDSVEGHLVARYINKTLTPKKVVALTQDGDYGADVGAGFIEQMKGDKVDCTPITFAWEKPDFVATAKSVMTNKPDAIFLAGLAKDMGPIIPALADAGFSGAFFGSQGMFSSDTIAKYAGNVEGFVVSSSMPPLMLAPGAFRIKNDFERKYGALTPLSAFSYAAAQIVISVVRRTNANDRVAVERAMNVTSAFNTVVGDLAFTSTGDVLNPNMYFYTVKNGTWKYSSSAVPTSYIVK